MSAGKQIVMLEVFTLDGSAAQPAEWDWSELAGDPVRVLGSGPFVEATEDDANELGYTLS